MSDLHDIAPAFDDLRQSAEAQSRRAHAALLQQAADLTDPIGQARAAAVAARLARIAELLSPNTNQEPQR